MTNIETRTPDTGLGSDPGSGQQDPTSKPTKSEGRVAIAGGFAVGTDINDALRGLPAQGKGPGCNPPKVGTHPGHSRPKDPGVGSDEDTYGSGD